MKQISLNEDLMNQLRLIKYDRSKTVSENSKLKYNIFESEEDKNKIYQEKDGGKFYYDKTTKKWYVEKWPDGWDFGETYKTVNENKIYFGANTWFDYVVIPSGTEFKLQNGKITAWGGKIEFTCDKFGTVDFNDDDESEFYSIERGKMVKTGIGFKKFKISGKSYWADALSKTITNKFCHNNKPKVINKNVNIELLDRNPDGSYNYQNAELLKSLKHEEYLKGFLSSKEHEETKRVIQQMKLPVPTGNYRSSNEMFAMAAYEATLKIEKSIVNKLLPIVGADGGVGICIYNLGSCSSYGQNQINFPTLDVNMGDEVRKIGDLCGLPASHYLPINSFWPIGGSESLMKNDIMKAFDKDKYATGSAIFPDGWLEWYRNYFGDGSEGSFPDADKIVSKIQSNTCFREVPNISGRWGKGVYSAPTRTYPPVFDGHTILDLASIFALLLPPPVGILVSSAIDAGNALWYVQEGHPWMAFFTAIGVYPGAKVGVEIARGANISNDVIKFTKELSETVARGSKLSPSKIKEIYGRYTKNMSPAEITKFDKEIKTVVDGVKPTVVKELYNTIINWEKYSRYDQTLLKQIFKDQNNFKILEKVNGNLDLALKEIKKKMSKESLNTLYLQVGLYVGMSVVLPKLVPVEWIMELYKTGMAGLKEEIMGNGFDWEQTLEIFGVANEKTNPEEHKKDIVLLENAWDSGWRPYKRGITKLKYDKKTGKKYGVTDDGEGEVFLGTAPPNLTNDEFIKWEKEFGLSLTNEKTGDVLIPVPSIYQTKTYKNKLKEKPKSDIDIFTPKNLDKVIGLKDQTEEQKERIRQKEKEYDETAKEYEEKNYKIEVENLKKDGYITLNDYYIKYGGFKPEYELDFKLDTRGVDWVKIINQ